MKLSKLAQSGTELPEQLAADVRREADGKRGAFVKVAAGLFKRKVLVAGTLINAKAIRFEPPLVVSKEEIDEVLNRLRDTLKEVTKTT